MKQVEFSRQNMKETQLVVSVDIFCVHASHTENKIYPYIFI